MSEKHTLKSLTLESLSFNSSYLNKSLNDNVPNKACGKPCGKLAYKTEVAEKKADVLIEMFKAPSCRLFFLKCVYHLPEKTIEDIISNAMRPHVKSPIKYFNYSAKQELKKIGY